MCIQQLSSLHVLADLIYPVFNNHPITNVHHHPPHTIPYHTIRYHTIHSCGSCSSKRVNLEEKYRLGEGGEGSRVCSSCFASKHENSSISTNTTTTVDINSSKDKNLAQSKDHCENQENAGINGSRAGVIAYGAKPKPLNFRGVLGERAIMADMNTDSHTHSAFSPIATGIAIAAGDLEAPTPDPKAAPNGSSSVYVVAVGSSRSRTGSSTSSSIGSSTSSGLGSSPAAVTSNLEIIPKGILKMPQAQALVIDAHQEVQPQQLPSLCLSPMSALLDGLHGRWDRSDDGMSTPGSVTSMMNYSTTNTAVTTPERMYGGSASQSLATSRAQSGDFSSPARANNCDDESYATAGSASVLRREQLAAHNTKLNIAVCRDADLMYSPLQASPASSSMVTLTPSPLPNTHPLFI